VAHAWSVVEVCQVDGRGRSVARGVNGEVHVRQQRRVVQAAQEVRVIASSARQRGTCLITLHKGNVGAEFGNQGEVGVARRRTIRIVEGVRLPRRTRRHGTILLARIPHRAGER